MNELAYYTEQREKREGTMDWMTEEWAHKVLVEAHDALERDIVRAQKEEIPPFNPNTYIQIFIAKAAARKVVEWCNETCMEHLYDHTIGHPLRSDCVECWTALGQEVGL